MIVALNLTGLLLLLAQTAFGYIPSLPTNDTTGLPTSDNATATLRWYLDGVYMDNVRQVLQASELDTQGVLMHFSETMTNGETTPTSSEAPWIALVSCDFNVSSFNPAVDIITLAADHGAVGVILYSLFSSTCVLDTDSSQFGHPLNVFSPWTVQTSKLIDLQFASASTTRLETVSDYNATWLNEFGSVVQASVERDSPTGEGFLLTKLERNVKNSSVEGEGSGNSTTTENGGNSTTATDSGGGSTTTADSGGNSTSGNANGTAVNESGDTDGVLATPRAYTLILTLYPVILALAVFCQWPVL
ncbi:hypothetical protein BDZ89DRAFT_1159278 [Hymenopellis radicata]|nr:hypothetical protein BDZ89DRAFT_1159278 [Hymenopellis radicata]